MLRLHWEFDPPAPAGGCHLLTGWGCAHLLASYLLPKEAQEKGNLKIYA